MIIDFHSHIFSSDMRANREDYKSRDGWFASLYADPRHKLASAEDVIASMDAAGVDRTVIMGFPWRDGGLCREHNDYLLDAITRYPKKLIAFACVQPLDAGDAKELDRCLSAGFMGLGELGPDGQRFDIPINGSSKRASRFSTGMSGHFSYTAASRLGTITQERARLFPGNSLSWRKTSHRLRLSWLTGVEACPFTS